MRTSHTCKNCGAAVSENILSAGGTVLFHSVTGAIACSPGIDDDDGGWCEPATLADLADSEKVAV